MRRQPHNIASEAAELADQADQHKRAVGYHRRRLRECKAKLAELQRWCDANGVALTIHDREDGDRHGETARIGHAYTA